MEFPLLTETVVFRGQEFQVRELTAGEFTTWANAMRKDPDTKLTTMAEIGTVSPKVTTEGLRTMPAALTILLAETIERLSSPNPKAKPASATNTA